MTRLAIYSANMNARHHFCRRCGVEFQRGEEVVITRTRNRFITNKKTSGTHSNSRWGVTGDNLRRFFHRRCFTDAHGEPIL